jgi:hypothetical protein
MTQKGREGAFVRSGLGFDPRAARSARKRLFIEALDARRVCDSLDRPKRLTVISETIREYRATTSDEET